MRIRWNWDARPFPAFPMSGFWGDGGNWRVGTWIGGKGPTLPPAPPDPAPIVANSPAFPTLLGLGWSAHWQPVFATAAAPHVSGREARAGRNAAPLWDVTLTFDVLTDQVRADVQVLAGFYAGVAGRDIAFTIAPPAELGLGAALPCRFADDQLDVDDFMAHLFAVRSLTLRAVRG